MSAGSLIVFWAAAQGSTEQDIFATNPAGSPGETEWLWRSLEHLEKPSTWCDFLWFSLSSWETMGNWDQHRFVVSIIEVFLKYYWSIIEVMFIHGLMVSDSHISHICSRFFSDGNLGGGRDVQRDPGWGRAFLWFSRQDLVTRCYSLMSSWCVRVVFIFVCLHPLQDLCFVTLHAAHTAHAAHAMNIKKNTKHYVHSLQYLQYDMFWHVLTMVGICFLDNMQTKNQEI